MGSVQTSLLRKENPSQGGDSTVTASPTNRFPLLVLEGAAGGVEPLELQRAPRLIPINRTLALCQLYSYDLINSHHFKDKESQERCDKTCWGELA